MLTAWLGRHFFPGAEHRGIPQVKTALELSDNLQLRNQLISLRIALGKILLPIFGLLSGTSVGFGCPTVHVGASLMPSLGKTVRFPLHYMERGLILAGSAAGFAAIFSGILQSPSTSFLIVMEMTVSHEILISIMAASFFATVASYLIHSVPYTGFSVMLIDHNQNQNLQNQHETDSAAFMDRIDFDRPVFHPHPIFNPRPSTNLYNTNRPPS